MRQTRLYTSDTKLVDTWQEDYSDEDLLIYLFKEDAEFEALKSEMIEKAEGMGIQKFVDWLQLNMLMH